DREHPPRRVEAERDRDEHRHAPVDGRARGDPERLGRDELLRVDRCREDRVVRPLEPVLDEGPEHGRKRAREKDGGRDGSRADELDVVEAADLADERAETEPERQEVDRRLDRGRERRRLPVRGVVDDLANENAGQSGTLESAEPLGLGGGVQLISSPVSITKTSSRFAGRRSPSIEKPLEPSTPRTETLVPVRRVRMPAAPASASTSASRAGGP